MQTIEWKRVHKKNSLEVGIIEREICEMAMIQFSRFGKIETNRCKEVQWDRRPIP